MGFTFRYTVNARPASPPLFQLLLDVQAFLAMRARPCTGGFPQLAPLSMLGTFGALALAHIWRSILLPQQGATCPGP